MSKRLNQEVENVDTGPDYGYCELPGAFFDRAILADQENKKTLLSVTTWDGRSIMAVER